jgi:hypothetical protein
VTAQENSREIEATGNVTEEGIVTVEATLGQAKVILSWHVDESEDPDMLVSSLPRVAETVLERLVEAQGGDRG